MEGLVGPEITSFQDEGKRIVQEDFLVAARTEGEEKEESVRMRYDEKAETAQVPSLTARAAGRALAVVDDDMVIRELIKTIFTETGWEVNGYENGKLFMESLDEESFDLIFLDLMMPQMNGFQVLEQLRRRGGGTPVIVLSAVTQREAVVQAMRYGVKSYLTKPLQPQAVLKKTVEALRSNF